MGVGIVRKDRLAIECFDALSAGVGKKGSRNCRYQPGTQPGAGQADLTSRRIGMMGMLDLVNGQH